MRLNMRVPIALASALLLGLGAVSAEATPLIINGGFEAVGTYPGWFTSMTAANAPGWTIGASSEFPIIASNTGCGGTYGAGNQGCNFAVLGGGETGGTGFISQTLAGFVIGDSYVLNWLQASEYVAHDIMNVQIIGASTLSQNFQTNPYTAPTLWDNWTAEAFPFVASAASLTFRFAGTGSTYNNCVAGTDSCDVGLDAVSVASRNGAPVPEPMTMLLVGSGLVGVALRRRWS
jgi:hypothetical protein